MLLRGPAILLTRITSETRPVGDLGEFLPLDIEKSPRGGGE